MVGRKVRLTLNGIDYESIDSTVLGRRKLDMSWETGTSHTHHTGVLYLLYNLLTRQIALKDQLVGTVY